MVISADAVINARDDIVVDGVDGATIVEILPSCALTSKIGRSSFGARVSNAHTYPSRLLAYVTRPHGDDDNAETPSLDGADADDLGHKNDLTTRPAVISAATTLALAPPASASDASSATST